MSCGFRLEHRETSHAVFIAVCYFPRAGSSRDVDTEERFQVLEEKVTTSRWRVRWLCVVTLTQG